MKKNGVKSVAIDDTEMVNLSKILEDVYPEFRQSRVTVIHNPKGSITRISTVFMNIASFSLKKRTKRQSQGPWRKTRHQEKCDVGVRIPYELSAAFPSTQSM